MKLLIIRLSALGDVAMTVPVVTSFAQQHPEIEITFLSKSFVAPLFEYAPSNFHFRGLSSDEYGNLPALLKLYGKLRKEQFDAVADLHDVLRTKVLRILFQTGGAKVAHIDKGRREKKELVRRRNKRMRQLPSSFTRYEEVFHKLGYPVETSFRSIYKEGKGDENKFSRVAGMPDARHWIGLAPFAAHKGKMLPEETTTRLIKELSAHPDYRIFLFGGKNEKDRLESWASQLSNVESLAGKLKLDEELALISHLAVMISMDSANMHLASLTNTPVISIWGATHYYAGFMGWGQSTENAVDVNLPCRPCSIFGDKPCFRKDYACLQNITPEMVAKAIHALLNNINTNDR